MIAFDIQAGLPLPDTQTVVEKAAGRLPIFDLK